MTDKPKDQGLAANSKAAEAPAQSAAEMPGILALDSRVMKRLHEIDKTLAHQEELKRLLEPNARTLKLMKEFDISASNLKRIAEIADFTADFPVFGTKQKRSLEATIASLKTKIASQAEELSALQEGSVEQDKTIRDLQSGLEQLRYQERIRHLLDRTSSEAHANLLGAGNLLEAFERPEPCEAFVLSIDVRRSTDLMLKARSPHLFAEFITKLAGQLREEILQRFGVFDKFTGDGVLAYFPDFFSGPDMGYLVAETAAACHDVFASHYRESRECFMSVYKNAGLGIGIDYGRVSIAKMHGELTIVGTPVVYACRLSGANAGETLINQPAFERLGEKYGDVLRFEETSISFKHEGEMVCYRLKTAGKPYSAKSPDWQSTEMSERADR